MHISLTMPHSQILRTILQVRAKNRHPAAPVHIVDKEQRAGFRGFDPEPAAAASVGGGEDGLAREVLLAVFLERDAV